MNPDHAPCIPAVGAGLTSEAGGMGGVVQGHLRSVKNIIPVYVGQGHLRRGDEPVIRVLNLERIGGKFGAEFTMRGGAISV